MCPKFLFGLISKQCGNINFFLLVPCKLFNDIINMYQKSNTKRHFSTPFEHKSNAQMFQFKKCKMQMQGRKDCHNKMLNIL